MKFTPLDIQRREFEKAFRGLDEAEVRTFLLNKHAPLKQLWYSSPVSGAHHYQAKGTAWVSTRDGSDLEQRLQAELAQADSLAAAFDESLKSWFIGERERATEAMRAHILTVRETYELYRNGDLVELAQGLPAEDELEQVMGSPRP